MIISEQEKNRIRNLHQGKKTEYLTEEDKNNPNLMLLNAFSNLEAANEDKVVNMLKPCIDKIKPILWVTVLLNSSFTVYPNRFFLLLSFNKLN